MADRPTATELVEAVAEFLAQEVAPAAADHRLKFRALVAVNALGIALRELEASNSLLLAREQPGDPARQPSNSLLLSDEQARELARQIRAGEAPEGTHELLKEHVAAKLRVSNPAYLERYG